MLTDSSSEKKSLWLRAVADSDMASYTDCVNSTQTLDDHLFGSTVSSFYSPQSETLLVDLMDSPPPVVYEEESTLGYRQKDLEHDADRAAPSEMGDEESLGVTERYRPLTPHIQHRDLEALPTHTKLTFLPTCTNVTVGTTPLGIDLAGHHMVMWLFLLNSSSQAFGYLYIISFITL